MTRRINKLIDGYLYVKINEGKIGLLESIKLPDTSLYQTEDCKGFQAEGLSVRIINIQRISFQCSISSSRWLSHRQR